MKKALLVAICMIFLCPLVFAEKQEQDKVKLKYNFKVGDNLTYHLKMKDELLLEDERLGGEPFKSTIKSTGFINYEQEVQGVDLSADEIKIKVSYGRGNKYMFHGDKLSSNPVSTALDDKSILLTMHLSGKLKDKNVIKGQGFSLHDRDIMQLLFVEFPENELQSGDSWVKENNLPLNIPSRDGVKILAEKSIKSKYTLLSIEKRGVYDCAKVNLEANINGFRDTAGHGIIVKEKTLVIIDGLIYYDLATGYVVYADLSKSIHTKEVIKIDSKHEKATEASKKSSPGTIIMDREVHTSVELL
ncbi:MAG: hypothetical protein GY853_03660 [PVC group bacterium]|nr:hypothetical protein [PVC group bacterium]